MSVQPEEATQPVTDPPDDGDLKEIDWDCLDESCAKCKMDPMDPARSQKLHSPTCYLAAEETKAAELRGPFPAAKGY